MVVAVPVLMAFAGEAVPGRVFVLSSPLLPWLAPVCILAGVAVQLSVLALCRAGARGLTLRYWFLCAAGALLVFAGAALDMDVTVAVGQVLACTGIWFAWRAP